MAGQNATTPRWLNPAEMKAWRRYIIASRRLLEALDSDLDSHELSMADYEVLAQLSDAPDRRMRMSELAEALRIDPSTLTRGVQRLERSGLAQRTPSSADGRVVEVSLTSEGERVHQVLVERRTELMTHILRSYRTGELRVFADLLDRFVGSVDSFVAQHEPEN